MDLHVKEFYRQFSDENPHGCFHKVIALHDAPDVDWKQISSWVPNINRGWFELAHLPSQDRIDFIRDFWLSKLPYHPALDTFLERFFGSLDDIGIFLSQQCFDAPFEAHLVYSLKDNAGFFRGSPGASITEVEELSKKFPDSLLPSDYLAFLQIHNGFWKTTDITGLIPSNRLLEHYQHFQTMLEQGPPVMTTKGIPIDPKSLIPFYESFGMPYFQCFWGEWYPEQEMGNIYFSSQTWTVSDVSQTEENSSNMSFPTFIDWLMFYLERVV